MTRIDFYGLAEVRPEARERFAVRLVARAWREGLSSLLLAVDEAMRARLDEALWADPGAFLPHADLDGEGAATAPVCLATPERLPERALAAGDAGALLVNLTYDVPNCFAAFDRVAEIVLQDEEQRARGRVQYRYYRERGYPLEFHDLARSRDGRGARR